jgi:hypothetical protein
VLKKIISIMLTVAVLLTLMIPAMAAGSSTPADKGLENAIKYVKSKIDIPKDCTKFSYNVYNRNDEMEWGLSWNSDEAKKYVSVQIDEDNFISSYSSYQYLGGNDKKIPQYSEEQGRKIAESFINNLDSSLLGQFKPIQSDRYSSGSEYNYMYIRVVNGVEYRGNSLNVTINSYTGQVTFYSCNYSKNTVFEDASKVISLNDAQKAYAEKLGLKLVYNMKTVDDKPATFLAYVPKTTNKYIDAITGGVENIVNRYGLYDKTASSAEKADLMSSTGGVANIALTPDELDAVNDMANLLSKEDADRKLRGTSFFNLDSSFQLSDAYLGRDWRNSSSLAWTLTYSKTIDAEKNLTRSVNITVDAKTGAVIDYSSYYPSKDGAAPQKSPEQAKAICEDVLKTLVPDIYTKVKYDDSFATYDDKNQDQYNFRFVRMENGLECPGNYISITYDNLSANVSSFYTYWTKDVKFEEPKNIISIDEANKVLFNKIGFGIQYIEDYSDDTADTTAAIAAKVIARAADADKAVLGYLPDDTKPCIISAANGNILDYYGQVYKDNTASDYTDIKGVKGEDKVRILTKLGIRYAEDQLNAGSNLLQKDYFILLCQMNDLYYFDSSIENDKAVENMYNQLIVMGIITKAEKSPLSALTREDAAKYFVKFLKLTQVAEIKGIYKSSFKDTNKINPDLIGYVCLASGLKAMNGSNGNFMPKNKMTRLEGLMTIYNYLSAK